VSQVYDTNFNVPAGGGSQTLSQSGNLVTLSGGGGTVDIGQTTDVSNNTQKLTSTTFTESSQSSYGLDTTSFNGVVEINNDLYTGKSITISDGSGTLTLEVDPSGNANIFPVAGVAGYSTANTSIGCASSSNAVTISQGLLGGQPLDQLVIGRPTTSGILLQGSLAADNHGYIRMNSSTGTEILSLGAGNFLNSQITLDRANNSVTINGPTTTNIVGTSTTINTTSTTINSTSTTISGELIMNNPVIKSSSSSNLYYWAYCPTFSQIIPGGFYYAPTGTDISWNLPALYSSGQYTEPMGTNGFFTVPVSGLYSIVTNFYIIGMAPITNFLEFCIYNVTTGKVSSFTEIIAYFGTTITTNFPVFMSAIMKLDIGQQISVRTGGGTLTGQAYINNDQITDMTGLSIALLTEY
jgi:hypothetical protein